MAAATVGLVTFAELEQLPDPPGGRYELHDGELIQVPPPKIGHTEIQDNLIDILKPLAGKDGRVISEFGFRPWKEHEYRIADVAFVSNAKWREARRDGYLCGSPELVIEVLSPSNTAWEIFDKERLCLETGAQEFWVVDPVKRRIKVSTADGRTQTYSAGQSIPVPFGGLVEVDAVFGDLE